MKPKILILEDSIERINWIKSIFDDHADIQWKDNVADFLQLVEVIPENELACLIFDHDLPLGCDTTNEPVYIQNNLNDSNDQNGYDAACLLPYRNVPCLIWSVNPRGRDRIEAALKDKGMVGKQISFLSVHYPALVDWLTKVIVPWHRK